MKITGARRLTGPYCGGLILGLSVAWSSLHPAIAASHGKPSVPHEHPRLLGSRKELRALARQRSEAYARVGNVAESTTAGDEARLISMALVSAIERDPALGRRAVQATMKYVTGPILKGHKPFGRDLAFCAIIYDLCYESWTESERAAFHEYMNRTVDANVDSETHVFANGWYAYKNWGIGLACYATYYENERAPEILATLDEDFRTRAAPALELAGDGGGWAEGYYINYWIYEWLFFCEAARRCEGVDYYELAPAFFRNRAVASMFEMYPGIREYGTRRPIPMGDGGGRVFGGDRDNVLSARRILVNRYRDDPAHRAVHAFNETTPRTGAGTRAYMDFLWRDPKVHTGSMKSVPLSHFSPGPGYVYARSSWDEGATYFFFKCGDRFTSHQHLDVGHFLIYKHEELAGDAGHYDAFGSRHDVNFHLRTIAHNTILVHHPAEQWQGATSYKADIRAGAVTGNDGGQMHSWPHHNGAVADVDEWQASRELYDIADILAFEDRGAYLYVAGDCSRAYSTNKLEYFTRQIVFIRPDTFVILDRVKSRNLFFKKTWLLQAMKTPTGEAPNYVIQNGEGRLFVQTLLPADAETVLVSGDDLYAYGGRSYPPSRTTGAAPECRIEVSPSAPAEMHLFLHVLTATDGRQRSSPKAVARVRSNEVYVSLKDAQLSFAVDRVGGRIRLRGKVAELAQSVKN
ncbi:hypothetical protein ACFLSJ_08470 [Verrucomicrobiota bacterium]